MSETNEQKIERFREFYTDAIHRAFEGNNIEEQGVNAKILLCSIIDSLAKSRHPAIERNGDRFKKTIQTSTKWNDCERISLLHLDRAIQKSSNQSEIKPLHDWVKERLLLNFESNSTLVSKHIEIKIDPMPSEIKPFLPVDSQGIVSEDWNKIFNKTSHKNLFWCYRNSLMHEYRIPGRALEFNVEDSSPFYQKISEAEDTWPDVGFIYSTRWELLYPTKFVQSVAIEILDEVAIHHANNGTSPFAPYTEGSYWIPNYNE